MTSDDSEEKTEENIEEEDGEVMPTGNVLNHPLNEEMKTSYINYAMSVIIGRALPDARDDSSQSIAVFSTECTKVATHQRRSSVNLRVQSEKSWVSITLTVINRFTTPWFEWLKSSLCAIH